MNSKKIALVKSYLAGLRTNLKGKNLGEKLVVIESDDWGAVRTPGSKALNAFGERGLDVAKSMYKIDALESGSDLDDLFGVLAGHRGADGKPVVFTANTIVANPDFKKIKESDYQTYFYEPFTETLKRYPAHGENLSKIKTGIASGVWRPQFHGREHLNVKRWMQALQAGDEKVRFCFDHQTTWSGKDDYSFMEAFDWNQPEEVKAHKAIIEDGHKLFMEIFGYASKTFIAPCYCWDPAIESTLSQNGVAILQGLRTQSLPTGTFDVYNTLPHFFGKQNPLGLFYNVRNCFFEPSMSPGTDWVNNCLARMAAAFHSKKPAVICSHRINYIGFIDENNKARSLKLLDHLLSSITKTWPDARFISTDQLLQYLLK